MANSKDTNVVGLCQLPLEVLEDIVRSTMSSEASGGAGRLASVNSAWQSIVEKKTFEELHLLERDVAPMMAILRNRPERYGLVRRLIFTITLPQYSEADCRVIESGQDKFQNDLVFSKSMNLLLGHLRHWPSTGRTLELQLYPCSPSDGRYLLGNQWYRNQFGPVAGDILHNRSYGSALELYRNTDSVAPAVTKLTFRDDCDRYIAVSGVQGMLRAFVGLRDVDIRFCDFHKGGSDLLRRSTRRQMAQALEQMPNTVGSMRFYVKYYPPADQSYKGQKISGDSENDPLTDAYRKATQKMTIVDVHGMLGTPELFWPRNVNTLNPAPSWPNLKYMELYYHILDPTGEWFFQPDPFEPRRYQADLPLHHLPAIYTTAEDIHPMQDRFTANYAKMEVFYAAVGKAVANMPKLVHLRAQALTYWSGTIAPFHVFEFNVDDKVGRATWIGIPPFRPSARVLKIWRKMAYDRCMSLTFESKEPE